jgi:hypothetical protein
MKGNSREPQENKGLDGSPSLEEDEYRPYKKRLSVDDPKMQELQEDRIRFQGLRAALEDTWWLTVDEVWPGKVRPDTFYYPPFWRMAWHNIFPADLKSRSNIIEIGMSLWSTELLCPLVFLTLEQIVVTGPFVFLKYIPSIFNHRKGKIVQETPLELLGALSLEHQERRQSIAKLVFGVKQKQQEVSFHFDIIKIACQNTFL